MRAGEPTLRGDLPDPFAGTTSAAAYVPCRGSEKALAGLLGAVREGRGPVALTGRAGIGKTLLLRVLADRLGEELHPLVVPYAALPPKGLCSWILGLLQRPSAEDPVLALLEFAVGLREEGSGLLLLIDDAGSMPPATTRWLGERAAASGGALRLVIAATDDATQGRTLAALGPELEEIRWTQAMSAGECLRYVEARLARAQAPEDLRARFDPETVARLFAESGGVPGLLHTAASAVMRETKPPLQAEVDPGPDTDLDPELD